MLARFISSASLLRRLPFLLPPLYLALVLGAQPSDQFGGVPAPEWLNAVLPAQLDASDLSNRLLYDDFDTAAMALRGLNAHLGGTAGLLEPPAPLHPRRFAMLLSRPSGTPAPHYFLEYPHLALALFRLPYAFQPIEAKDVHSAIRDGAYHNLVRHVPRTSGERRLWQKFRNATRFYAVFMTGCLLLLMALLAAGYGARPCGSGSLVLLVMPAAMYFSLNRFDVVPALLTASSLACLGRRRIVAAAVMLAVAALVKVYPLLLAPLVVRYLWDDRRSAQTWVATFALTLVACSLPPILISGGAATWAPYAYQLSRPLWAVDWTGYGVVLPEFLAEHGAWRLGAIALVVVSLTAMRRPDLTGLLRRGCLVLIAFVWLAIFYSPQWILWLAPLLAPLARQQRSILWLAIALDFVTYASFPIVFDLPAVPLAESLREGLVYARFAILGSLAWILLRAELRAT